jgi:pimeloyl-ACP methyl ester carboxylesterase
LKYLNFKEWESKGDYFSWNRNRIFYLDEGVGEAVLFLHGFPTSSWDWRFIWPSLKNNFRLVALDFLGFGFSDKPRKHSYSISEQADICLALLEKLGIHTFHIVAHDYGDTVAQEICDRSNDHSFDKQIRSLVLLNGGIYVSRSRPRPIQKLLLSPVGFLISKFLTENIFRRSFSRVFGPETKPDPDDLDQYWQIIKLQHGHRIPHLLIRYISERRKNFQKWEGSIDKSDIPILAVIGILDPVSGKEIADEFQRRNPNEQLVRIDDVGHYPQTESPVGVLMALEKFWGQKIIS